MTKVDTTFKLSRPLTDEELKKLARVHTVYGMLTVRLLPDGDGIFIEYDASRLSAKEARATLEQHGIPLT